jgi:hypothetical protein
MFQPCRIPQPEPGQLELFLMVGDYEYGSAQLWGGPSRSRPGGRGGRRPRGMPGTSAAWRCVNVPCGRRENQGHATVRLPDAVMHPVQPQRPVARSGA